MIKYSDETRREALETYRTKGIKVACEQFHVPTSTIYRWLSIEKREALLSRVAQECNDETTMESGDDSKQPEPVDEISIPYEEVAVQEEDVPDMMTLLTAENEKLRAMNLQLRKALQALVL